MKVISPSYSSPLPRLSLASFSSIYFSRTCPANRSTLHSVGSILFRHVPWHCILQFVVLRNQCNLSYVKFIPYAHVERGTQNAERRTQNPTYARQYTRTEHVTSRHITMQTMTHRGYDSGENGDTLHISVVVSRDDTRSLQSYLPSTPIKIMLIHV